MALGRWQVTRLRVERLKALVEREKIRNNQLSERRKLNVSKSGIGGFAGIRKMADRYGGFPTQRMAREPLGPPVPYDPASLMQLRAQSILGTEPPREPRFDIPSKSFGERLATSKLLTESVLGESAGERVRSIPVVGPALERNVLPLTTVPGLAATAAFPAATLYGAGAATAASLAGQAAEEHLGAPENIVNVGPFRFGTRGLAELGAGVYGGPGGGVKRGAPAVEEAAQRAGRTIEETGGIAAQPGRLLREEVGGTGGDEIKLPEGIKPKTPEWKRWSKTAEGMRYRAQEARRQAQSASDALGRETASSRADYWERRAIEVELGLPELKSAATARSWDELNELRTPEPSLGTGEPPPPGATNGANPDDFDSIILRFADAAEAKYGAVETARSADRVTRLAERQKIIDAEMAAGASRREAMGTATQALSGEYAAFDELPVLRFTPQQETLFFDKVANLKGFQQEQLRKMYERITRGTPQDVRVGIRPFEIKLLRGIYGDNVADALVRLNKIDRKLVKGRKLSAATKEMRERLGFAAIDPTEVPAGRLYAPTESGYFGVPKQETVTIVRRPLPQPDEVMARMAKARQIQADRLTARQRKDWEKAWARGESLMDRARLRAYEAEVKAREQDVSLFAETDPTGAPAGDLSRGSGFVGVPGPEFVTVPRNPLQQPEDYMARVEAAAAKVEDVERGGFAATDPTAPPNSPEWLKAQRAAQRSRDAAVKDALKGEPRSETLVSKLLEGLRIPITIRTTADMSFHLRQGWKAAARNPGKWWKSLQADAAIWRNPEQAEKIQAEMFADQRLLKVQDENGVVTELPWGRVADENMGLHLDMDNPQEDFYLSQLPEKIPGAGGIIKRSRLGFTTSGNVLRHEIGYPLAKRMMGKKGYVTQTELKQLAELLMPLTGRGDTRFMGEWLGNTMRNIGFAPGYRLSGPQTFMRLASPNPVVRRAAAENLGAWFAATSLVMAGAYLAGQKVGMDPLSPEFGGFRIGNTTYNLWGTDAILARTIARSLWGLQSGSLTGMGKSREVTMPDGTVKEVSWPTDMWTQLRNYGQSGLNPLIGDVINLYEGENVIGDPISLTDSEGRKNLLMGQSPLHLQDILDINGNDGIVQAILSIPLVELGLGSTSYETNSPERIISSFPKFQDLPLEQEDEFYAFKDEVEALYQELKYNDPEGEYSKPQLALGLGEDTDRNEIAAFAAADFARKLEPNWERIAYVDEHQDELDAETLRRELPIAIARSLLSQENMERYNSVDMRIQYGD